jgi:hypothetical protein
VAGRWAGRAGRQALYPLGALRKKPTRCRRSGCPGQEAAAGTRTGGDRYEPPPPPPARARAVSDNGTFFPMMMMMMMMMLVLIY